MPPTLLIPNLELEYNIELMLCCKSARFIPKFLLRALILLMSERVLMLTLASVSVTANAKLRLSATEVSPARLQLPTLKLIRFKTTM